MMHYLGTQFNQRSTPHFFVNNVIMAYTMQLVEVSHLLTAAAQLEGRQRGLNG